MNWKTFFSTLADQIRRLTGRVDKIKIDEMVDALSGVELGVNIEGLTAASSDVVSGKLFVGANGEQEIGTMVNRGAVDITLDSVSKEYTVTSGYHNGKGKVRAVTQTKTATPSDEDVTVYPDSGKFLSAVTVKPGVYTGTVTVNNVYRILLDTGITLSEDDQAFLFLESEFSGIRDVALSRRLSQDDIVTYRVNQGFWVFGEGSSSSFGFEIVYVKSNGKITSKISFQTKGYSDGAGYSSCLKIGDTYRWILVKR